MKTPKTIQTSRLEKLMQKFVTLNKSVNYNSITGYWEVDGKNYQSFYQAVLVLTK